MEEGRENMKAMSEALLFVSAEPLVPKELKQITDMHESEIASVLEEIAVDYAARGGGVVVGMV